MKKLIQLSNVGLPFISYKGLCEINVAYKVIFVLGDQYSRQFIAGNYASVYNAFLKDFISSSNKVFLILR